MTWQGLSDHSYVACMTVTKQISSYGFARHGYRSPLSQVHDLSFRLTPSYHCFTLALLLLTRVLSKVV